MIETTIVHHDILSIYLKLNSSDRFNGSRGPVQGRLGGPYNQNGYRDGPPQSRPSWSNRNSNQITQGTSRPSPGGRFTLNNGSGPLREPRGYQGRSQEGGYGQGRSQDNGGYGQGRPQDNGGYGQGRGPQQMVSPPRNNQPQRQNQVKSPPRNQQQVQVAPQVEEHAFKSNKWRVTDELCRLKDKHQREASHQEGDLTIRGI